MSHTNGFISGPYTNIWVGCFFLILDYIRVAHVAPLNSLELVLNQTIYAV